MPNYYSIISTTVPGAPTTGTWATGQQITDSSGVQWICSSGGTPGTWGQSAAYVPTDPAHAQVGAPTTGTHATGEVFIDANGAIWACSAGGTPGTWFAAGSGVELGEAELSADPAAATTVAADIAGLTLTFTAPARAFILECTIPAYTLGAAADELVVWITDSANVIVGQIAFTGGNASFATTGGGGIVRARLPRTGGANAYAITPGNSYTFKVRQLTAAGTAQINTNSGQFRPIFRAVTC